MTSICEYIDQLIDPTMTRLILYPNDTGVEIDVNTWWLSAGPEDTIEDLDRIESKVRELATAWTTHFVKVRCRSNHALFYCWYDEQAGQLRVSLSSISNPQQHFGATVAHVDSPRPIIQQMLNNAHSGFIPMDELVPCDEDDEDGNDEKPYILLVWADSHTW